MKLLAVLLVAGLTSSGLRGHAPQSSPLPSELDRCRQLAPCAAVLNGNRAAEVGLNAVQRRQIVLLRTSIALAGMPWEGKRDWLACMKPGTDSMTLRVLQSEVPDVVDGRTCALRVSGRALLHSTGQPAREIGADWVFSTTGDLTARLSFLAGSRWGITWLCRFRDANGILEPASCVAESAN